MSKIQNYHKAKAISERLFRDAQRALGRDSPSNDKHTARARFWKLLGESFTPIAILIDLSYGYYGSSSGYSATSDQMGEYLARAINKNMTMLLDEAVKMAQVDAEKARKEAEEEARAVLQEVG